MRLYTQQQPRFRLQWFGGVSYAQVRNGHHLMPLNDKRQRYSRLTPPTERTQYSPQLLVLIRTKK